MKPRLDDLAEPNLSPDECYVFGEEEEYALQSTRPRATAIRLFAREHGVAFAQVSCRRRYMRLLTRQESYEAHHIDNQFWSWFDDHDPELTRDGAPGYACRAPDGSEVIPPQFDQTVPSDWSPNEVESLRSRPELAERSGITAGSAPCFSAAQGWTASDSKSPAIQPT